MSDTVEPGPAARSQLSPERMDEVRDVLHRLLTAPAPADLPLHQLLVDARRALTDVLTERDALVAANAEAAEELAAWVGAL
ncbi:hypothetical protein OG234_13515 [Streptomyces sp. NBC_01420]|uniref:hypothetical protein n=1 Tax=Streptomyces sp. NBC_01420 TaxID=2903858 RepID=UPI003250E1A2